MKLETLKLQIQINRKILSGLNSLEQQLKEGKRLADALGLQEAEYKFHNALKEVKRKIAPLVKLQKALKADATRERDFQRSARRQAAMAALRSPCGGAR